MAFQPDIFSLVMEAMHSGSLVLTPNHRTRLQLQSVYGQWRQQRGLSSVCITPAVYPVDIWLRDLWSQAPGVRAGILEPALEGLVWQDIIRDSDAGAGLVNQRATSRAVQEAWRVSHLWCIDMATVRKFSHFQKSAGVLDDLGAFLSWVDTFETFCLRQDLISLSPMVEFVIAELAEGLLVVPEHVVLAGFDNPPPLYARLFEVLTKSSKTLKRFNLQPRSPATRLQGCNDSDTEIRQVATWAANILASDDQARIGIICPDLQRRTDAIQRIFRDILYPQSVTRFDSVVMPEVNISSTRSLADCPLLASALDILALNTPWVETLKFCRLLRSPFIHGSRTEESGRARLEWRLRETGEMKVQMAWVRNLANDIDADYHCGKLASALLAFESLRRAMPNQARLHDWSDLFEAQLAAMGWPGQRQPDPVEYDQLKGWSEALRSFARVSAWHEKVSLGQALGTLQQILAGNHARSGNEYASVQVLTPTEADGLLFTHTWMMGMTEQQWPPPARPVPFIPMSIQRDVGMPASDVHEMTENARHQISRFIGHTVAEIVFSWPRQEEDLVLKPAGMLSAVTTPTSEASGIPVSFPGYGQFTRSELDTLQEAPFIPLNETEQPAGGISLIAYQADCPFKAFAIHRLGADALPAPLIGLPGHVLGSILHEALDSFWCNLKNQNNLLATMADELATAIDQAVTSAVHGKARLYRHTMTVKFNTMEIRRLSTLLTTWLEEEKRRGTFAVIESEYRTQWQHAGLTLNLRIDRLDATPSGKKIIVDYKSSKNREINWFDPRQTEPQLMLYMLAFEAESAESVDGLFIAQVNVEEAKYKGISNDNAIYPSSHFSSKRNADSENSWQAIQLSWRESLTTIANEFLSGYAAVDPKSVKSSCTWCHLGPLCRIGKRSDT
jgi:ATP-dependent helicase/nuclease subunit B